jgi:hypothetical protein
MNLRNLCNLWMLCLNPFRVVRVFVASHPGYLRRLRNLRLLVSDQGGPARP